MKTNTTNDNNTNTKTYKYCSCPSHLCHIGRHRNIGHVGHALINKECNRDHVCLPHEANHGVRGVLEKVSKLDTDVGHGWASKYDVLFVANLRRATSPTMPILAGNTRADTAPCINREVMAPHPKTEERTDRTST
jgi:hypothetical protein